MSQCNTSERNREEGCVYGVPGTFAEIQRQTEEERQNHSNDEGLVYIPNLGATFKEIKEYTIRVKQEELCKVMTS